MLNRSVSYFVIAVLLFLALVVHIQAKRFVFTKRIYDKNIEDIHARFKTFLMGQDDFNRELEAKAVLCPFLKEATEKGEEFFKMPSSLKSLVALNVAVDRLEAKLDYQEEVINRLFDLTPLKVFRTDQKEKDFFDVCITNSRGQEDFNKGSNTPMLDIGFLGEEKGIRAIQRGLMRVGIYNRIPKGVKIVSAVLHVKQYPSSQDKGVFNEKINLYELKRTLGEVASQYLGPATDGAVSWLDAVAGQAPWSTPGIWPDERDVDLTPIAIAKGIQKLQSGQGLAFYFNAHGIESLEKIINGGPNYGWLMKLDSEESSEALVSLGSINHLEVKNRPYLEIKYVRPKDIDWLNRGINQDKGTGSEPEAKKDLLFGYFNPEEMKGTRGVDYNIDGQGDAGFITVDGLYDQAFYFLGPALVQRVSLNVGAEIANDTQGTVSFWVKDPSATIGCIFSLAASQGLMDISLNKTTIYFNLEHNDRKYLYLLWEGGKTGISFDEKSWHHIVFAQDGVNLKLYVDGEEKPLTGQDSVALGDKQVPGAWFNNISQGDEVWTRIGARVVKKDHEDSHFEGILGGFRYYSRALSSPEIISLYKQGQEQMKSISINSGQ